MIALLWLIALAVLATPTGFFWCCCDECIGAEICFTAQSTRCGVIEGVSITVKQGGVTIGSCTTDVTGECCVAIPAAGSYDIVVGAPAGSHFSGLTFSTTATCSTNYVTVNLPVQSGWSCANSVCCKWPIPDELSGSDTHGGFTITRTDINLWEGDQDFTDQICDSVFASGCGFILNPTSGTARVHYEVQCDGEAGGWRVFARWAYNAWWTACISGVQSTPGWAYVRNDGVTCLSGTNHSILQEATSVSVEECAPGVFALSATFAGSIYDSDWGLTITSPTGGSASFSV